MTVSFVRFVSDLVGTQIFGFLTHRLNCFSIVFQIIGAGLFVLPLFWKRLKFMVSMMRRLIVLVPGERDGSVVQCQAWEFVCK